MLPLLMMGHIKRLVILQVFIYFLVLLNSIYTQIFIELPLSQTQTFDLKFFNKKKQQLLTSD